MTHKVFLRAKALMRTPQSSRLTLRGFPISAENVAIHNRTPKPAVVAPTITPLIHGDPVALFRSSDFTVGKTFVGLPQMKQGGLNIPAPPFPESSGAAVDPQARAAQAALVLQQEEAKLEQWRQASWAHALSNQAASLDS